MVVKGSYFTYQFTFPSIILRARSSSLKKQHFQIPFADVRKLLHTIFPQKMSGTINKFNHSIPDLTAYILGIALSLR